MRLIIEASEDAPVPVEPAAEPEPVVDTSKTDELEGKIIKYKKKLRMEKEKIQSLEDQLAISAQELDKLRSQALEDQGRPDSKFITEVPNEVRLRELEAQLGAVSNEKDTLAEALSISEQKSQ